MMIVHRHFGQYILLNKPFALSDTTGASREKGLLVRQPRIVVFAAPTQSHAVDRHSADEGHWILDELFQEATCSGGPHDLLELVWRMRGDDPEVRAELPYAGEHSSLFGVTPDVAIKAASDAGVRDLFL
jgi:hypothetical protein